MSKLKEVWVKFSNMEAYSGNEGKLFEILDKAPGNCIVVAYIEDGRGVKRLSGHRFDEKQISLLEDTFGGENVKYQEKEVKRNKTGTVPKIKQILPCNHDMYAVVTDSDGAKHKYKVLMYALCSDGEIYPLHFDNMIGVSQINEAAFDVDSYELEGGEVFPE